MPSLLQLSRIVVLTLCCSMLGGAAAQADKPSPVPRLIVTELSPVDTEPEWLEPYSVALIAVPNDRMDSAAIPFTLEQDCELIAQRIVANTGFDEIETDFYAAMICAFLEGTTAIKQNPLHATMGTVESNSNGFVYWAGGVPPAGARARSGPDGDIIFLGTFGIPEKTSNADPYTCPGDPDCGAYRIVISP